MCGCVSKMLDEIRDCVSDISDIKEMDLKPVLTQLTNLIHILDSFGYNNWLNTILQIPVEKLITNLSQEMESLIKLLENNHIKLTTKYIISSDMINQDLNALYTRISGSDTIKKPEKIKKLEEIKQYLNMSSKFSEQNAVNEKQCLRKVNVMIDSQCDVPLCYVKFFIEDVKMKIRKDQNENKNYGHYLFYIKVIKNRSTVTTISWDARKYSPTEEQIKDLISQKKVIGTSVTRRDNSLVYGGTFDVFFENYLINKFQINENQISVSRINENQIVIQEEIKVYKSKLYKFNNRKKLKIIEKVSSEKIEDNLNTFYKVLLVKDTKTSKKFLAKVFYVFFENYPPKLLAKIYNILNNTLKIKYPSILEYVYFNERGFDSENRPTLFTEFIENSTLEDVILSQNPKFDATKKLINIYGIASAMQYLHSLNIMHLDLTPERIIEDRNFYPKIKDFGMSGIFKDINSILRIKKKSVYLAPECYTNNKYDEKCDVYSFSLIIYQIMMNKIQFKGINIINHVNNIIKNIRPEFNDKIPKAYIELIEKCWASDPNERPTFEIIVDEIEKNPEFITEEVNKGEFKRYIQLFKSGQKQKRKVKHGGSNDDNDKEEEIDYDNEEEKEIDYDNEKEKEIEYDNEKEKEFEYDNENEKEIEYDNEKEKEFEYDNENEKEIEYDNENEKEFEYDNEKEKEIECDNDDDKKVEPDNDDENLRRIHIEMPFLQEEHIIDIKKYEKGKQIGEGGTSLVYEVNKISEGGTKYAAKVFTFVSSDYIKLNNSVAREVEYQMKLAQLDRFPKFIGYSSVSFDQAKNPLMMIELLKNGSLYNVVKKGCEIPGLNEKKILNIIIQIASAMNHLHLQDIIHRDLKLENILLDEFFNPKLSDFGLLIKESEKANETETVGTAPYIAPEIWNDNNYSKASDVYAFGILVYELVTKKLVFRDKNDCMIMYAISIAKSRPQLDGRVSAFYRNLIRSCWDDDPGKRPTFAKIIEDLEHQLTQTNS